MAALPAETALLDGEVVVEDERGISDFSLLQTDLKEGDAIALSITSSIFSISTAAI